MSKDMCKTSDLIGKFSFINKVNAKVKTDISDKDLVYYTNGNCKVLEKQFYNLKSNPNDIYVLIGQSEFTIFKYKDCSGKWVLFNESELTTEQIDAIKIGKLAKIRTLEFKCLDLFNFKTTIDDQTKISTIECTDNGHATVLNKHVTISNIDGPSTEVHKNKYFDNIIIYTPYRVKVFKF
jgi:hypothetical protein